VFDPFLGFDKNLAIVASKSGLPVVISHTTNSLSRVVPLPVALAAA
jgi:hypothetical protein